MKSTHVVLSGSGLLLFIAEYRSVRGHNKLWTPSLGGSLGCFQFLPVTNNAAVHILGQDFQWIHVFISDGYIRKVPASFFSTVLVTVRHTMYLTWFTICLCPQGYKPGFVCVWGALLHSQYLERSLERGGC